MKLKPTKIFINDQPYTIFNNTITYDEICEVAGYECPEGWKGKTLTVQDGAHIYVDKKDDDEIVV
jgi:hypothetical protein